MESLKKIIDNKWILLGFLTLTWGSSFLMIKKALLAFTPYEIGSIRILLAGLLLSYSGIKAVRKYDLKTFFYVLLVGLLGNYLPLYLVPLAQTKIDSSLAGILDSLTPIFVVIVGVIIYKINIQKGQIMGVLIGFIGSLLLFYRPGGFSIANSEVSYSIYVIIACLSYAIASLIIKQRLAHINAIEIASSMFTLWSIPAFIVLLASGTFTSHHIDSQTLQSLYFILLLTIFGTIIALMLYYHLIQKTTAVFANSVSYLLPIVAVILGVFDGEPFSLFYLLGGGLILLGIGMIHK